MNTWRFSLALTILMVTLINTSDCVTGRFLDSEDMYSLIHSDKDGELNKYIEVLIMTSLRSYINATRELIILDNDDFDWKYKFSGDRKAKGNLVLTNGVLHGLSTVQLKGNSILTSDDYEYLLTVPITFKNLKYEYTYSTKYQGEILVDYVKGELKGTLFTIAINIDKKTFKITLKHIEINQNGETTIKKIGNHSRKKSYMLQTVLSNYFHKSRLPTLVADKVSDFLKIVFREL